MLELGSWWPVAQGLELGERKRSSHGCGEGRTLIVNRTDRGYHAWCHRCSDSGWSPPPAESLADKLERLARLRRHDQLLPHVSGSLPEPSCNDVDGWPTAARLWLYKAGLSRADIGRLGIYYHGPSDRVVVPVYENGEPVFYQARAYQPGRQPKYLGPTPRPPKLLPRWGSFVVPTLTEDMLSAIKIGTVAEGIALLGTNISDHIMGHLLKRNVRVNVWTDPDPAGRKASLKIRKQLMAYGLEVRDIVSDRDPKLHTRQQIMEHICNT